jgi:SAM-dependent methyltransferase
LNEPYDYIILDYPFGYLNERVGKYIDLTVFVDTPLDVALARRIIRDYTSRSQTSDFGLADVEEVSLAALDKELRFYLARSRPTYARMPEMHKPVSDLVVDGTKSPSEIANEIISFITTRNHYDALIDENNDPVHDPKPLKEYMNKWDGDAFIEAMQLTPNKSLLEIGVGTGRLAARVCGKYKSFIGIDISAKTIERAKENLKDFPNVRLICGEYLSHPFDKRFDVIFSSLTFMHIRDKQTAIQKAADLLNHGGRFVLSISKEQQTILDFGNRQIEVYPDTPEEIATLLIGTGLTIEKQFETEFAVVFVAQKEKSRMCF